MTGKPPGKPSRLRARAERIARKRPSSRSTTRAEALQELAIHQVELEMQVEELRRAEQELTNVRDRYQALYDDAPVGYITVDVTNLITRANRVAARLLGVSGSARGFRRFTTILDAASRATFYAVSADVRQNGGQRAFDAFLPLPGSAPVWVELTLAAEPRSEELRITLVDVTEKRTAEHQMRDFAEKLISLQEKERSSVAQTLHADTGQQLTYLCILLERARSEAGPAAAARIDEALEVARSVLAGIRALSTSLAPAEIGRVGIVGALRTMVAEFTRRTQVPVSFGASGPLDGLPIELCLTAYRMVQEALTNAARHGEPRRVSVLLHSARTPRLHVEVRDDGKGFDVAHTPMSLGLLSMRERARGAGGTLVILSSPGHGTHVVFDVPGSAARARRVSKSAEQVDGYLQPKPKEKTAPRRTGIRGADRRRNL